MRHAIVADIHSNLTAFQAVLADLENNGGAEDIWCLGDVVGYGPEPKECIELLRQYRHLCIAGNHDWAAVGKIDIAYFNPEASQAVRWTAEQLSPEDVDYLQNLPLTIKQGDFTLAHGSPREPIWEYVLSVQTANINFNYFDTKFCFVGHSHVPLIFDLDQNGDSLIHQLPGELSLKQEEKRLIINCGGVGQPRDGDPRASYAIFDDEQGIIYHYRTDYDISTTQQKMQRAGLPSRLIDRLSYGW